MFSLLDFPFYAERPSYPSFSTYPSYRAFNPYTRPVYMWDDPYEYIEVRPAVQRRNTNVNAGRKAHPQSRMNVEDYRQPGPQRRGQFENRPVSRQNMSVSKSFSSCDGKINGSENNNRNNYNDKIIQKNTNNNNNNNKNAMRTIKILFDEDAGSNSSSVNKATEMVINSTDETKHSLPLEVKPEQDNIVPQELEQVIEQKSVTPSNIEVKEVDDKESTMMDIEIQKTENTESVHEEDSKVMEDSSKDPMENSIEEENANDNTNDHAINDMSDQAVDDMDVEEEIDPETMHKLEKQLDEVRTAIQTIPIPTEIQSLKELRAPEEMLMIQLLKLDSIDLFNITSLREKRKSLVREVQERFDQLDLTKKTFLCTQ